MKVVKWQGLGHIAFHVGNVEKVLKKLVQNEGRKLGGLVKKEIEGLSIVRINISTSSQFYWEKIYPCQASSTGLRYDCVLLRQVPGDRLI